MLVDGVSSDIRWPARLADPRLEPDETMALSRLAAVWRGELDDPYADAAVAGTIAIALHAQGAAETVQAAEAQADALWRSRDPEPPAGGGLTRCLA